MTEALRLSVLAKPTTADLLADRVAGLFDRHHLRLHRLGLRMLGDAEEARELVQETFLRAAREAARLPSGDGEVEAWLVRVAVNLCRDRRRRLAVRRSLHGEMPADVAAPAEDAARLARAAVRAALRELPGRRRAVVVLHELEGLTAPEVGRLLGIPAVTVRWHLLMARRELARRLGGFATTGEEERR